MPSPSGTGFEKKKERWKRGEKDLEIEKRVRKKGCKIIHEKGRKKTKKGFKIGGIRREKNKVCLKKEEKWNRKTLKR